MRRCWHGIARGEVEDARITFLPMRHGSRDVVHDQVHTAAEQVDPVRIAAEFDGDLAVGRRAHLVLGHELGKGQTPPSGKKAD